MADNYMLKKSKIVLWSLRNISIMAGFVVMSYVSYFATNCLGISAGVIGALLLASKLFDGITDLIAGYFVEKPTLNWEKDVLMIFALLEYGSALFSCSQYRILDILENASGFF